MHRTAAKVNLLSYIGVTLALLALVSLVLFRDIQEKLFSNASQLHRASSTVNTVVADGNNNPTYACAPQLASLTIPVDNDYFLPSYGNMSIRPVEQLATPGARDSQESVSLTLYGPINSIKSLIVHSAGTGVIAPDEQLATVSQVNLDAGMLKLRTADFTTGYIDYVVACIEPDIV